MESTKIEIILEDGRSMKLELDQESAPLTVSNFLSLVKENFYDGTIFHRVIDKFMIQGGGYIIRNRKLIEKEAKEIKGEFASNGVVNPLKHKLGVISMARTSEPNSASSQFFICVANCKHLDGEYAAFGKIIDEESLVTLLDISKVKTTSLGYGMDDFPIDPIVIKTIKIL